MRNRAICKSCNTIIESKHRHDFVRCKCEKIFIDGGQAYQRCGFEKPEYFRWLDDDDKEHELEGYNESSK